MEKPAHVAGNVVALGRGDFFAVDRRVWARAHNLGLNAMVAYLTLARGTGHDQRTTSWSVHAVETHTGLGNMRAKKAIAAIVAARLVRIIRAGTKPRYFIAPAHEVPYCEGYPPPNVTPTAAEQAVFDRLAYYGGHVHPGPEPAPDLSIISRLIEYGWIKEADDNYHEITRYDADEAAEPQWIWLPNSLITGAGDNLDAPVELLRQTQTPAALRLLIDLYGAQGLADDGGVHWSHIYRTFQRHRLGERGPYIIWGFAGGNIIARPTSPLVTPHIEPDSLHGDGSAFWTAWDTLRNLGLVELVNHLIEDESDDAAMIAPYAIGNTGLPIEREIAQAAHAAGVAMLNSARLKDAAGMHLAPLPTHLAGVTMVGIARLRYRPRTARTAVWLARTDEWRDIARRMREAGNRAMEAHPAD